MAQQFFEVAKGLKLNNAVFLAGSGAPNGLNDQASVGIGSFYTDTTNGVMYIKKVAGSGAANWVNLSSNADLQAELDALELQITNEVTARQNADTALQTEIDNEEAARIAADNALQGEIDALEAQVTALGNAFNYVGVVSGGVDAANATDLALLPADGKNAGDYYKVSVGGYFKVGAGAAFVANTNDGLVFNTSAGVDIIDNTNSNVSGTAGFVTVSGSTDTGFVVDLDAAVKADLSQVGDIQTELDATQASVGLNADGSKPDFTGVYWVGATDTVIDAINSLDNYASENDRNLAGNVKTVGGVINAGQLIDVNGWQLLNTFNNLMIVAQKSADIQLTITNNANNSKLTVKQFVEFPMDYTGETFCDDAIYAMLKTGTNKNYYNSLSPKIEFKVDDYIFEGSPVRGIFYRFKLDNTSTENITFSAGLNIHWAG